MTKRKRMVLSLKSVPFDGRCDADTYEEDAQMIADKLFSNIPGGTFDRLMPKLLGKMADQPNYVCRRALQKQLRDLQADLTRKI